MENSPFNLFEKKSKSLPSKTSKSPLDVSDSATQSSAKKSPPPSTSEINEMIEKMKKLHDQLNKQIEDTYQHAGIDDKLIKRYLDNPNNFEGEQWKNLQNQRQALLKTIWTNLGEENLSYVQSKQKEKQIEQAKKERKGKTLGARRNWISMR